MLCITNIQTTSSSLSRPLAFNVLRLVARRHDTATLIMSRRDPSETLDCIAFHYRTVGNMDNRNKKGGIPTITKGT